MDKLRDGWNGWKEGVANNAFGDSHLHRWLTSSGVHCKIEARGIRQMVKAFDPSASTRLSIIEKRVQSNSEVDERN